MVSTIAQNSPHILGAFLLAVACVPLFFVVQDHFRRSTDRKRVTLLRREAKLASELRDRGAETGRDLVDGWAGPARR